MSQAEVYAIVFPNGLAYVGCTMNSVQHRIRSHVAAAKAGSHLPQHVAMREFNYEYQIELLGAGDRAEMVKLEATLIETMGYYNTNASNADIAKPIGRGQGLRDRAGVAAQAAKEKERAIDWTLAVINGQATGEPPVVSDRWRAIQTMLFQQMPFWDEQHMRDAFEHAVTYVNTVEARKVAIQQQKAQQEAQQKEQQEALARLERRRQLAMRLIGYA